MPPDLGVSGKVVLITGAARGLGLAFAEGLAAGGALVVLADVDRAGAERAAAGIAPAQAFGLGCDVTDPDDVARAVAEVLCRFGRIDGLVNDAGTNQIAPSVEADLAEWRRVLEVNLFGAFVMSREVGRHMIARRSGSIVNIASIHAHVAPAFHPASAYAASKAGLLGLTRALAVEWGRYGVRVNAVAPGFVRTEMTRARLDDPDYRARVLDRSPLGEIAEPQDLIGALYYLLSDASRLVTGQAYGVDAGWTAV